MSKNVTCDQYGIELKDKLGIHIKTQHHRQERSCMCAFVCMCVCVCIGNEKAIFMVPKSNKYEGHPNHVLKDRECH